MAERIGPIRISVSGRPDSAGLRIKTADPIGLYLSSENEETAKEWFFRVLPQWAIEKGIVRAAGGCFIGVADYPLDWTKLLIESGGLVHLELSTRTETEALKRVSTREINLSIPLMIVDRWLGPQRQPLWMVRDPGNFIDDWLVNEIKKDLSVPN